MLFRLKKVGADSSAAAARRPRSVSGKGLILLGLALLLPTGCAVTRPAAAPPRGGGLTATPAELIAGYDRDAEAIHTLNLALNIGTLNTPPKGGLFPWLVHNIVWLFTKATQVNGHEYYSVSGHLLLKKPADLRVYGTLPVVGSRAFDLATDGQRFEISLATKSEFLEGLNSCVPPNAKTALQRLRPAELLEALPVAPIGVNETFALRPSAAGEYDLWEALGRTQRRARELVFSRADLHLSSQTYYDARGAKVLEAKYSDYAVVSGVSFPGTITVEHPGAYSILFQLTKPAAINDGAPAFSDATTFALIPPPGAQVIAAGACNSAGAGTL